MEINYVKDTFEEYLNGDGISASDIKTFLKSPRLYYYQKHNKQKDDNQRHFSIGSAAHEMILEPELFSSNYLVCPKIDKRTKEGKEQYAKFVSDAEGKTILYDDEMEMVIQMAANARMNPTLMELLADSYYEVSCYTTDEKTGLSIRLRPDILPTSKSTIVDIKTCIDSSPRKFKNDVYSYGYSISAAFYSDFLMRENYVFAAIEKSAPFQASLYVLSDDMVEYGRTQYRMALDLLKWSIDNNYWCDYVEFEVLKESYELGSLDTALDTIQKSELIKILE